MTCGEEEKQRRKKRPRHTYFFTDTHACNLCLEKKRRREETLFLCRKEDLLDACAFQRGCGCALLEF
jgi:hypothetical protein